uniref:Mitochondrial cardiolipin hydrolase n=1 Tax=Cacopsylla melanoneura TaxID=428564 RepID=A0A8D8X888_9HEMI
MDWIVSFVSQNYFKISTAAFVCLITYNNYRLQEKRRETLLLAKLYAKQLAATKQKLKDLEQIKIKESLCDVIFFVGRAGECADHIIEKFDCPLPSCPASKIRKMVSYIDAAETSIDMCLYLMTNKTLGDSIFRAYKRGVKLRIISDGDMAFASGSQFVRLLDQNIPVYLTGPPYIMHEKYLILDSTIVMEGSMNFTTQACSGNYEHVVISGAPGVVNAFRNHFDTLYELLKQERKQLIRESEKMSDSLRENWD